MPFFSTFCAFINIFSTKELHQVTEIQIFTETISTKKPFKRI